jgi:tripartite-type tricarboxylate transporter receptor subunit TctC
MFGPSKLPGAIVDKIRIDLSRILNTPEMRKIYETNTLERDDMTPDQFVQFIRSDTENWARQIKAAGIQPE